jgi:hypothetical protein
MHNWPTFWLWRVGTAGLCSDCKLCNCAGTAGLCSDCKLCDCVRTIGLCSAFQVYMNYWSVLIAKRAEDKCVWECVCVCVIWGACGSCLSNVFFDSCLLGFSPCCSSITIQGAILGYAPSNNRQIWSTYPVNLYWDIIWYVPFYF